MSGISNTITVRYEHAGEQFEVLVDPKLAYDYKTGVRKSWENVLVAEEVFKDANRGERQTAAALKKAFGPVSQAEACKLIFEKGELQLTTDQRRKALAEKKIRVVALIARVAVDPRTKAPHPVQRIENAIEEAGVHIDAFKPAEEQVARIIEELREIIPISTEESKVEVIVPAECAGRCYGMLKEYGISGEEWRGDGSLRCVCAFPAGLQGEFYNKLNKMTSGNAQTKLL
ncbi:MAG: ribosome assembly factor SBDS [Candidatus Micrarchaeia archaeon]